VASAKFTGSTCGLTIVHWHGAGRADRAHPDPVDGRSSRITLTEAAHALLPQACAVLLEGNCEVLSGFTDEEAAQLVSLFTRLIANLDRVASTRPNFHSLIVKT
jgi:hypothetical protein